MSWKLHSTLLLAFLLTAGVRAQDTQRQYLSGHGKDDAVPWRFFCTGGRQSGYWTNLPVPSNWELHGFGTLNYHRDPPTPAPEEGRYERDFKVSRAWARDRVFLVFEGVMTDASALLNGQAVGPTHQGAYYRFKYDVTGLLKYGAANHLEVNVAKKSANPSVNTAERKGDYWMYGGIFRPVHLEAVPPQFIERVAIDARADGEFRMEVFVDGSGSARDIEAQLTTLDGQPVGPLFAAPLARGKTTLKTRVSAPRQWTAETPNLYRIEVRLKEGRKVVHRVQQRFGFRTFEVREGDGLYLNGRRVILKGCDRHSFWPDSGRCLSEAVHRLDIQLMKNMNMNAVRMSHYPPDVEFLDLCDEQGLYVLDELAGWQGYYDTETGARRVEEMVTRDVNHPSILFWDNGNEGGFNTDLDRLFPELDPQQRRVLHPWALFGGVNTAHYRPYDSAKALCAGTNVYMPTEFLHGLFDGGAGAGLKNYWDLMETSKVLGGGFIWAFLDEGVRRPDTGRIDVAGNQAPDGIVGPYRQKEASFFTIKEVWSPIRIREQALPASASDAVSLTVENHFCFTDARDCGFVWQLRKFRRVDETGAGYRVLSEGKIEAPSIPPGEIGALRIGLNRSRTEADALALQANDPAGRELWTWVWPLPGLAGSLPTPAAAAQGTATARISEAPDALVVHAGELTFAFSKQSGLLTDIHRGKQKFSLANGPRPAVGEAELLHLDHSSDGPDALVTATFSGAMKSVRWRVRPSGWLQCDYTYMAEGPNEFFGVAFDYPEARVKGKRWLGLGPYRVWQNRLQGTTFNVWQNDYNDTITGWADWVYPEFKGCFAGVRWLQLQTTEGPLTVVPGGDDLFLQVLTPRFPPVKIAGKASVALPEAGLAFLHAIPPMGSKFHTASQSGPGGQRTVAEGEYHGSVNFFFGKLP
ncbi:MAG TPA: glycoside hydrolase family 2 TIM barrel-domain containing protein [Candidatus Acidoferrum sp.]|nr:glycoside hydrolase family 2 TIM barrel-domain containing protein [Candidatus Acidoferrum sp.]